MILIARFLYKEADIYLIEKMPDEELASNAVNRIFRDILLFKTVVFISRRIQLIRESKTVYLFDSGELVQKVESKAFLRDLKRARTPERSDPTKPSEGAFRRLTKKQMVNNSMISGNANFDHELRLHRKTLLRNEKMTKVLDGKSWLEKIVYGIYLTQKKRTEGEIFIAEEPNQRIIQTVRNLFFEFCGLNKAANKPPVMATLLLLISKLMFFGSQVLIVTYFRECIFVLCSQIRCGRPASQSQFGHTDSILCRLLPRHFWKLLQESDHIKGLL
jgi:hypothetical protein